MMPVAMGLAQPVSSGFSLRGSKRISQVPVSRSVRTPARRVVVRAADEAQKAVDEGVKGAEDAVESTKEALAPKGGQTTQDKIDEVGREISKATQQSSGLTIENTTVKTPGKEGGPPSFEEAMAFSGPAPERINSRLAMVAFAAAAGAEIFTGAPVAAQIKKSPILIGVTFLIFIIASLVPILRGEDVNKESGPFTVRAELWNGRLAMMGFILLLLIETFKSSAAL